MSGLQSIAKDSDRMTFGKHKGESVEDVLKFNPSYVLWCHDEKIVKFPKEIVDLADEMDTEERNNDWSWGIDVYDWMDEPF